jgi:Pregnancy-associated plasma protein-A/Secretion system C-terminal sorting domain
MAKYLLAFIASLLVVLPAWTQNKCGSNAYRLEQLRVHPELSTVVEGIERFTRKQQQPPATGVTGESSQSSTSSASFALITIPVVVHVLYNTASQNISNAQIESQIAVLNNDYQKLNPDTVRIPSYYAPRAANSGYRFILAGIDPNGNTTTGVARKHTDVTSFAFNDDMKSSATGGDDAWDADQYLNIWVCNLQGGTLGYSSIVGGNKAVDGVAVLYTAFGTGGTAQAPFNEGRTCTHEVGHWLNLIHTWGDAECGDDQVADTPPQQQADYGNPGGIIVTCGNTPYGNMYMNYMDFTDDIGMHMFTYGQRDRMRALFAPGGYRYPLLTSPAATAPTGEPAEVLSRSGNFPAADVFPNPASSYVSINLKDPAQVGSLLSVYTLTGQVIMAERITQSSFQLNVSGLAAGLYFIHLGNSEGQQALKFVKL